jgi:AraC-like DNA-binding protein
LFPHGLVLGGVNGLFLDGLGRVGIIASFPMPRDVPARPDADAAPLSGPQSYGGGAAHSWQVAPLAAAMGMSRRQLERHFLGQLGVTPQRWLEEWRLRAARELLWEGHPVKNVAERMGFRSVPHFRRWFKRRAALTPGEYVRLRATTESPPAPAPAPQNVAFRHTKVVA